jgi:hypothetical protein
MAKKIAVALNRLEAFTKQKQQEKAQHQYIAYDAGFRQGVAGSDGQYWVVAYRAFFDHGVRDGMKTFRNAMILMRHQLGIK